MNKLSTLPRTLAFVDLQAITTNLKKISEFARPLFDDLKGSVAMVKCDAYGHGVQEVASALEPRKDLLAFGVATLQEGIHLRKMGFSKPIWVFSDCAPWTETVEQVCKKFSLTPVLHSEEDLRRFLKSAHAKKIPFHLKFNTGMNRLGIPVESASKVARWLRERSVRVEGICSHLASSDLPHAKITRFQVGQFLELTSHFRSQDIAYIHCANTEGILHEKDLKIAALTNIVRPGIGLYGYGSKFLGLKPAMRWCARAIEMRWLKRGDSVGYGAEFQARSRQPMSVLGVGYGDGLKRALSNKELELAIGQLRCSKIKRSLVLGRVSMDSTAIAANLTPGKWVTLLGDTPEQGEWMAKQAGTIIYEVLTSISVRVPRFYR